jgi:hypothetical protein
MKAIVYNGPRNVSAQNDTDAKIENATISCYELPQYLWSGSAHVRRGYIDGDGLSIRLRESR